MWAVHDHSSMMGVNMSKILLPPIFFMSPEKWSLEDDVPFKMVPFLRGYVKISRGNKSEWKLQHLEPQWPLFLKVNSPKQGLFQSKQGSWKGSRYIIHILHERPRGQQRFFHHKFGTQKLPTHFQVTLKPWRIWPTYSISNNLEFPWNMIISLSKPPFGGPIGRYNFDQKDAFLGCCEFFNSWLSRVVFGQLLGYVFSPQKKNRRNFITRNKHVILVCCWESF